MPSKRKHQQEQAPPSQPTKRSKRLHEKKSPQENQDQKQSTEEATSRSIVGGLKDPTLNSRVSTTGSDPTTTFSVPYKDGKRIICERHGTEVEASEPKHNPKPKPKLIFTHGAGGGLANPATRIFAEGFGAVAPAVCMQGTMNLKSRADTFRTVIAQQRREGRDGEVRVLGGRSMGARAATIAATEEFESADGAKVEPLALVLVSYPLVSGGKQGNEDVRDQILYDLPEGTGVLFIVGSEDAQCPLPQLQGVMGKMKGKEVWLVEVDGADHSMSLKSKGAVEPLRRKSGEVAARWVEDRDFLKSRHVVLRWDEVAKECDLEEVK